MNHKIKSFIRTLKTEAITVLFIIGALVIVAAMFFDRSGDSDSDPYA